METQNRTDEQILEALTDTDKSRNQILHFLFKQLDWKGKAVGLVVKNGGTETEADEIAADAFTAFDQNIRNRRFKGNSKLETYFLAIVKFKWRKLASRKKPLEEIDSQRFAQNEDSIEDDIIKKESYELLKKATAVLGEKCKKIFRLIQLGYSGDEMAVELNLKNAAMAKKATYRCRKKFREYLKENPQWKDLLK